MNHITIVYATEEYYISGTVISMLSVIEAANAETFCDFYIFVDGTFSNESRKLIQICFKQYEFQCSIKFQVIGNVFDDAYLRIDFIKKPTYFRLLAPQLLKEERCIYLDSDTIVCTDLYDLFNIDMKENYIAGVKAPVYILRQSADYCKQALLPDIQQYINAGVLLMNLEQMRKDNVVDSFLKLLPFNMMSQDQDIINSVCYDRIIFLPFEFNVMTKYAAWTVSDYSGIFTKEELMIAWNSPGIIHYADRMKPWKSLNCVMGDYWWNICKRSHIWDLFYKGISDELFFGTLYTSNFCASQMITKRPIALFNLLYKRKIIIYGAGDRAAQFIAYLKSEGVMPLYIIVSNQNNPSVLDGIKVRQIERLPVNNRDSTVIIATMERYHVEILRLLQKYKFREIIPLCDDWKMDEKTLVRGGKESD